MHPMTICVFVSSLLGKIQPMHTPATRHKSETKNCMTLQFLTK